jgi:uncharacterized protein YcbX
MAVVARLVSYPVKGCAGVRLTETSLEPTGLPYDRAFMVVDERGVFRSQRRDPMLAVIRAEVSSDGGGIVLRAPGAEDLRIEVDVNSARQDVELFGVPYQGIDQGRHAAAWLSSVLGAPSRLVRVPPEHDRIADGWVPGPSHYADSSAVHLISQASLDALNGHLVERGEPPVPMARFRPNIVISGWDEPHLEDRVRWLTIGNAKLAYAKLAIRCAVPLVDQRTGTKAGREPLRTLATYRRAPQGGIAFGVKLSVVSWGNVRVGDNVYISSWDDSKF